MMRVGVIPKKRRTVDLTDDDVVRGATVLLYDSRRRGIIKRAVVERVYRDGCAECNGFTVVGEPGKYRFAARGKLWGWP